MTQGEISAHLGLSERKFRDVLARLELDHRIDSIDKIRIAYIEHLRTVAAGRESSSVKEEKDRAEIRKLNGQADKIDFELLETSSILVDASEVRECIENWIAMASQEFISAFEDIIGQVESDHEITVSREKVEKRRGSALKVLSDYRW